MKFACDQCKTKYTIADERVRGKVLKIRCKNCSFLITVREEAAPSEKAASDSTLIGTPETLLSESMRGESDDWHLSVDGEADGPMRLSALARRVLKARKENADCEVFVWRDGFGEWLPPQDVPEVAGAMQRQEALAAPPTPGVRLPAVSGAAKPPEAKADAKPAAKPETKTDAKAEAKPETKTDAKAEAKPKPTMKDGGKPAIDPVRATINLDAPPPRSDKSVPPPRASSGKSLPPRPPTSGKSLGGTASSGGAPKSGASLGAPPPWSPPKSTSSLPRSPKSGESLGAPPPWSPPKAPKSGESLGAPPPWSPPKAQKPADEVGKSLDVAPAKEAPVAKEAPAKEPSAPEKAPIAAPPVATPPVAVPPAALADKAEPAPAEALRSPVLDAALGSLADTPASPPPGLIGDKPPARSDFDLAISEPSMLIDLSKHGAWKSFADEPTPGPASTPAPAPRAEALRIAPASEQALPVVAASADISQSGSRPAPPMVVVAAPAPQGSTRQLKMVLAASLCICVVLLGTIAYLLTSPPQPPPKDGPRIEPPAGRKVDDRPVTLPSDPGGAAVVTPTDGGLVAKAPIKKGPRTPRAGQQGLNSSQTGLRDLYGDPGDRPRESVLPQQTKSETSKTAGLSGEQLGQVVQRNKKSLASCYDRYLKHDETLRSARINVTTKIGLSGRVSAVELSGAVGGTDLGTCMQQVIRRWVFPPNDSDYEFQFPLFLQAS